MTEVQRQKGSPFGDFPRDSAAEGSPFEKASEQMVRIDVDGRAWLKLGSAIAHYGDIQFKRLPAIKAKGIEGKLLRAIAPLVSAEGKGRLYCARSGWRVRIVQLAGDTLNVSADELLAFQDTLEFDLFSVGKGVSMAFGGKVITRLSGTGALAIAVHGNPMVLSVTPEKELRTDPHATVAWTNGLSPTLAADLSWRSLLGKGGGEAFQMLFTGSGEVVIQPSEDSAKFSGKKLKSLL